MYTYIDEIVTYQTSLNRFSAMLTDDKHSPDRIIKHLIRKLNHSIDKARGSGTYGYALWATVRVSLLIPFDVYNEDETSRTSLGFTENRENLSQAILGSLWGLYDQHLLARHLVQMDKVFGW